MVRRLIAGALLVSAVLLPATAHADARVSIANSGGQAEIDPTYATTLRVSGNGFQSIRGGHGGIYVFFGTVKPGWQPSKGGATGSDYFYVPDSESKGNQGYQRYVAFPGSDTASSANGGTMNAAGSWSTDVIVPGASFRAYDRAGSIRTIDCRKVTCGVITVGAHGVSNTTNETFTPVAVGSLGQQSTADEPATATDAPDPTAAADPSGVAEPGSPTSSSKPVAVKPPTLEVDREAAVAGNVLAFTATGLTPGAQVSAVFDDGTAGAGPFAVGVDGQLAGVVTLPADTAPGTHELRLYGVSDPPSVKFAVRAAETPTAVEVEPQSAADDDQRAAWLFAGVAALVLLLALTRLGVRFRKARHADA